jgi:hypothetical protein
LSASNDGSGSGLDADKLDGHESGNASDNIPISNGTVCVNLDADRVDGYDFNQSLKTTDSPTFANINANINPSRITGGYTGTGRMYLNTHPENGGAIVPFINNDLAFLTKKGGAMTSYKTTNTDYTPQALTNSGNVSIDTTNPFDGSPSYAQFSVSAVGDVIIIDITCHTVFAYTTSVYIDFGASYWSARNISFYAYNSSANNSETVYKPFGSVTNSSIGEYCSTGSYTYVDKNGVTQQGFNKLRIVLTNFNTTSPRIACIGVIGFGSSGLKETFISRGGSSIYGDFYPLIDNSYVLGGSSNRWKNVYAVAFNGSLVGNADSASKWSTARTLSLSGDVSGSTTIDGSGNASITATVADDSHNHIITNIDGLQTALDSKANSASPIFTGTPTAPTPATTDNSKNIATTEFVKAQGYITSAGSGAKIAVNPTEPTSPQPGDFWFKVL